MFDANLLCITCLSNSSNGIAPPPAVSDFLLNIFGFKFTLRAGRSSYMCLPCYRTLCEVRRFYTQLKDVEQYFNEEVAEGVHYRRRLKKKIRKNANKRTNKNKKTLGNKRVPDTNCNTESDKVVHQRPLFKCAKCYLVFDTADTYKVHMRWHTTHKTPGKSKQKKQYKCEFCGKLFATSVEKRSHKVTHTIYRPYKCGLCFKIFRQASSLGAHRCIRLGKQVECPEAECGKRFTTNSVMLKHIKVHKRNRKTYQCESCPLSFLQHDDLREHRLVHSEQFECDVCNEVYCNEETFLAHVSKAHNLDNSETAIPSYITDEQQVSLINRSFLETDSNMSIEALAEEILG